MDAIPLILTLLIFLGPVLIVRHFQLKRKKRKEKDVYDSMSEEEKIKIDEKEMNNIKQTFGLIAVMSGVIFAQVGLGWIPGIIIATVIFLFLSLLSKKKSKKN